MEFVGALAQFKPWRPSIVTEHSNFKKSAILVPLQLIGDELFVIMTVRAKTLSRYSGDVSFPGGMQDPSDNCSFITTALREAEEEIGLKPEAVRVLCQLRPCVTQHGIIVVPVVGLVTDSRFEPKINRGEVEECFKIELNKIYRQRITWKSIRVISTIPYNVLDIRAECKEGKTRRIWGVTANVLLLILLLNAKTKPEFIDVPITYLDIDVVPITNKL